MQKLNKTKIHPSFKYLAIVLAIVLLMLSSRAFAADYKVDRDHSRIGFSVKHLMLTTIHGQFNDFSGSFSFDSAKNTMTDTKFVVQTASIFTGTPKRDEHLKSADFFEVSKYPTMTLENVSIKRAGKDAFKYKLMGDLTLHGKTKRETFDLVYTGVKKDNKSGENRIGFSMTGKINRLDYGMNWAPPIEGDIMINHDVFIEIDISAVEVATKVPGGNDKLYETK